MAETKSSIEVNSLAIEIDRLPEFSIQSKEGDLLRIEKTTEGVGISLHERIEGYSRPHANWGMLCTQFYNIARQQEKSYIVSQAMVITEPEYSTRELCFVTYDQYGRRGSLLEQELPFNSSVHSWANSKTRLLLNAIPYLDEMPEKIDFLKTIKTTVVAICQVEQDQQLTLERIMSLRNILYGQAVRKTPEQREQYERDHEWRL